MDWIDELRVRRALRCSPHRERLEHISPALRAAWQRNGPQEFPGMPTGRLFFHRALAGLVDFFDVSARRGQPCALPSLAADSVWHAWSAWDADDLARFCRRHFGMPIVHLPQSALDRTALAQTLVGCRALEGRPAQGPGLPALFGLDAGLRMPNGHGYWIEHGDIVYRRLDAAGRKAGPASVHPDLALPALFGAGLVSEMAYLALMKKYEAGSPAASQTGDGGVVIADGGGGNGCADGGGGGGGGCGGCGGD
ncbi:hypothetical protein [Telluria beijingensis]|uniref:hypothetical protein n=1 Tax=Telluria beijingensis TaxID=3068633 RepID=UPI002795E3FC|nr:hypothetical protein [Massilia sp. REN29]